MLAKLIAHKEKLMWVGVGFLAILAVFVAKELILGVVAAVYAIFADKQKADQQELEERKRVKTQRALEAADAARRAIAQKEASAGIAITEAGKKAASAVDDEIDAEFK